MKSKAPLVMMEQIIMVLIFALAAALCLQAFALSGKVSGEMEAKNRAAVEAQNAAELMKTKGMKQYLKELKAQSVQEGFRVFFDENWNEVPGEEDAVFYLNIYPENHDSEYFWKAEITVTKKDGTELFGIPIAGQTEVTQNE